VVGLVGGGHGEDVSLRLETRLIDGEGTLEVLDAGRLEVGLQVGQSRVKDGADLFDRRILRWVSLVVFTHGHFDHIGAASELKEATGAKLAIHEKDAPLLEGAQTPFPPGITPWGRFLSRLYTPFMPLVRFPPATVDLVLGDDGLSLRDYGIPGRVIHTPGHTAGSISVLLETGEAFVGDLAMSKLPLRRSPGLPVLAEDRDAIVRSWRLLLDAGATTVYLSHGRPFPAEVIQDAIGA